MQISRIILSLIVAIWTLGATGSLAQDSIAVRVNGKALTETDLKLAEAEVGSDLGSLAGLARRRVLAEFLVETQLLADAAEAQKLSVTAPKGSNPEYWLRRALRDAYFERVISKGVEEKDVRAFFDEHVGNRKAEEEVRASHILVTDKDKARELHQKIAHGADFADLARQFSNDPGSKEQGGDLGFFVKGQMVPQFEEAAFGLKPGEVSEPFETQFGWHIVKVIARRERELPPYEAIKERVRAAVVHSKAQQIVLALRSKAQIEYVDPEIRKMVDAEKRGATKN